MVWLTVVPAHLLEQRMAAVFDFAQFAGTRASAPRAFIGFGEESAATNPCLNLFEVGRPGKNVAGGACSNLWHTNYLCGSNSGFS
jgi:hypothetical protein